MTAATTNEADLAGGTRTRRRLSPAAIGRYRLCPKQFWFADVLREPRNNGPSPTLVVGNAVHHALERFFGLPLGDRSPENLERALRSVWPEHRRGAFVSREEEAAAGRTGLALLASFATRFDLLAEPLAREQWVSSRLPSGIELAGKIDRVDRGRRGGIEIVDYKTGRRTLEPEDLRREPAAQLYLLIGEDMWHQEVERVRLVYLADGSTVNWEPERDDVAAVRDEVEALVEKIVTTVEFEAAPGSHCRWCPFQLRCPERQQVTLDELIPVEGLPF